MIGGDQVMEEKTEPRSEAVAHCVVDAHTVPESLAIATLDKTSCRAEAIFVVEDDPLIRKLAVRVLERQGYHIHGFSNGQAALEAMTQQADRLDLLLTDMVVPETNGKQMAERMRANRPTLRVLFTSGYSDTEIADRGALQAKTAFLAKPYSTSMLTQKVREILDA
jgi:DNA-binding NtrC family response regulator